MRHFLSHWNIILVFRSLYPSFLLLCHLLKNDKIVGILLILYSKLLK